jgi:tetratricopeptide (TPR) repeat protein
MLRSLLLGLLLCCSLASCESTQQSALSRGNACLSVQDYDCAIEQYELALRSAPSSGHALTNLAWVLATAPAPAYRDGERAVDLAAEAVAVAEREGVLTENLGYLIALAVAHAEAGDFDAAVRTMDRVLELTDKSESSQGYEAKYEQYRASYLAGQP